ncbi:MAG: hypothetical protein J0H62_10225, partial [Rhizobiales bacterium]|nr:hypothetical protein [Hyphomicrobiales bacterium]
NSAIRLALNRKVTINSMAAGEKLFVDLLPEGWTALPPPLPRAVIEDLSRRAFEAEKRVRAQQQRPAPETAERIRVRAATMPTFTRYTFPLRERVSAKAERDGDQLRVTFDKPLKFDLADVRVALPSNIGGVEAQSDEVSSAVRFALTGKNEVRSFREEGGAFVVDVGDENLTADAIAPRIADAGEAKSSEAKSSEAKSSEAKAAGAKPDTKSGEKKPVAAEARASDVKSPVATKPGAPPPETTPAADGNGRAAAFMRQQGDVLRLIFPFEKQTAAAVFRRDDSLWIVFDATAEIDTQKLTQEPVRGVTSITHTQADGAQVIRLKLARNYLASATADGDAWIVTLADAVTEPSQPIGVDRLLASGAQPRAAITFADLGRVHRIADPESGETVIVVTGMAPARGVAKTQDFVEFRAPQTTHGIAIEPVADDLVVACGFRACRRSTSSPGRSTGNMNFLLAGPH